MNHVKIPKLFLPLLVMLLLGASLAGIGLTGQRYAIRGTEYYQRGDYQAALKNFQAANRAAEGKQPEYLFWLGKLNIAVQDTAKALQWFDNYLATEDTAYRQETLDYLRILNRQESIFDSITMRRMPAYLNSRNSDYGALLTPDNKYLWFTSLTPTRFEKENIWKAERLATGWARPYSVDELNTDKNEAIGSFSRDGKTAYIFGNFIRGQLDGDIFSTTLENGKWQTPVPITAVNSPQVESHPMVYRDSLMFFASSREGGYGDTDIYLSIKKDGEWGLPVNLGPQINTPGSEQTPFLDDYGRTLFFASNYHAGFGGFDIFKAVHIGDSWQNWSDPDNLGLPLNSIRNDRHFIQVPGSTEAMFSTDRDASGFEKLYVTNVVFTVPQSYIVTNPATGEKTTVVIGPTGDVILDETGAVVAIVTDTGEIVEPPETTTEEVIAETEEIPVVEPPQYVTVTGRITDEKGNPLAAEIELITVIDGQTSRQLVNSNSFGNFSVTLPKSDAFNIIVNKEGYLQYVSTVTPPADGDTMNLDIKLKPLEVEKVFVFQNILFDFDKAVIKPESYPIVDEIVVTMLSNPKIKIEISGHTCDIGTDEYNLTLSKSRAKAVVDYLVSKGVETQRLTFEGYGETKPLNENKDDSERIQNRRVEVKVIK